MAAAQYRLIGELAERVRGIPLEVVLESSGARRDPLDKAKWRTERGPVSVTGSKFMNWKREAGGGGAIDLVMHLRERGFLDAVCWLAERFPSAAGRASRSEPVRRRLELPAADPRRLGELRGYLLSERGLSATLTEPLLDSGEIYADTRGNAVFVLLAEDGTAVGAELRGTTGRPWRSMAPGSRKDRGYFSVCAAAAGDVVLTESAIDALSCAEIHPGRLCLSTAGARSNPRWLSALLEAGKRVHCGYDSDPTGDRHAEAMIALHPSVRRLRPPLKDWNDTLRSTSGQP